MTHLTELAEHLSSRRLGEGDWDNVSLVAEWLDTSLNRCGLSLTSQPDSREALAKYGQHLGGCRMRVAMGQSCVCGWDEARAALVRSKLEGANGQAVKPVWIDGKHVEVDAEIAALVAALNSCGFGTVASCSGHGHRPANIALADGREIIIARDFDEARRIDALFPLDINGSPIGDDVREEWSLCFYGSPPAVIVKAGIPGLPDSRRDIGFVQFINTAESARIGKLLRELVNEHNTALTTSPDTREALFRVRNALCLVGRDCQVRAEAMAEADAILADYPPFIAMNEASRTILGQDTVSKEGDRG